MRTALSPKGQKTFGVLAEESFCESQRWPQAKTANETSATKTHRLRRGMLAEMLAILQGVGQ